MKQAPVEIEISKYLYDHYTKLLHYDPKMLASGKSKLNLIHFSQEKIISVCMSALSIFKKEPNILTINSPLIVVGDIHGQFIDLIRIIKENGLPNNRKYVFLGDLVDRGEFSLDVVLFILSLKTLFPSNVFLLRGNHEFHSTCGSAGFLKEIKASGYSETVYSAFLSVFVYLPLCAVVDNTYFLTHAGIGPDLSHIEQIQNLARPIYTFGDPIIDALLWSDPNAQLNLFQESTRGTGFMFGKTAIENFLSRNKFKMLIRGHESISQGYEYQFGKLCLTIFSASNYCGQLENDGAILLINSRDSTEIKVYPPLPFLPRKKVVFTREKELPSSKQIPKEIIEVAEQLQIKIM
ncbi:Serine/threonine-protein phosphatase PP1-2 [Tritrichomonas foetus]|uniref:Serine/threonine-protein phosphatase n=1 Tax=Tritrichomonas foetus TaxID=1144522 RepID=A0A1J4KTB8_9EUKA|nr:Serine/threonine-protein phosphatase PP1-2 [Tritrichomonas foetus]|eukprot:OHT14535.1 Serine/threonine-protein phosphatase PP1-2 [Tritrichomonas foetus]